MRYSLLQATGMVSRVYLSCYRPLLAQFLEVDMVSYGHMVSWTFEYLVPVAEVRTLEVKLVLHLMDLLHLFLAFEERGNAGLTLRYLAGCWVWFARLWVLDAVFLPAWLHFLLACLWLVLGHIHLQHPHVSRWLNGHVFYFAQDWLIFVGIFVIGNGGRMRCLRVLLRFFR